jgi:hypothetical protein
LLFFLLPRKPKRNWEPCRNNTNKPNKNEYGCDTGSSRGWRCGLVTKLQMPTTIDHPSKTGVGNCPACRFSLFFFLCSRHKTCFRQRKPCLQYVYWSYTWPDIRIFLCLLPRIDQLRHALFLRVYFSRFFSVNGLWLSEGVKR